MFLQPETPGFAQSLPLRWPSVLVSCGVSEPGAFLALGLSFPLVIQALANMAVNVTLFPVTGVTLPLVSMGGSSFLFTCLAIGIILSVARNVEQLEGSVHE